MSIERLSAEDRLMLWPDEIWPQDIGALVVLDGSSLFDPAGRFRIEAVREAVEGRLHLLPRFRQLRVHPASESEVSRAEPDGGGAAAAATSTLARPSGRPRETEYPIIQ